MQVLCLLIDQFLYGRNQVLPISLGTLHHRKFLLQFFIIPEQLLILLLQYNGLLEHPFLYHPHHTRSSLVHEGRFLASSCLFSFSSATVWLSFERLSIEFVSKQKPICI